MKEKIYERVNKLGAISHLNIFEINKKVANKYEIDPKLIGKKANMKKNKLK